MGRDGEGDGERCGGAVASGERPGAWWDRRLFGLWVLVNSAGYVAVVVGGAALEVLASSVTEGLAKEHRWAAVLVTALVGGTVQGVVVGRWQWRILRRRVPDLRRNRWVGATLVPALLVWLLVVAPGAVDTVAEGGDALGAFRGGFTQAVVLGPLIGVAQAVALRGDTSRWAWWFAANVTTYLAGAAVYASGTRLLRALSLPGWVAPYLPVAVFAFHGAWMLWVTAPGAVRRAARTRDAPRG